MHITVIFGIHLYFPSFFSKHPILFSFALCSIQLNILVVEVAYNQTLRVSRAHFGLCNPLFDLISIPLTASVQWLCGVLFDVCLGLM